MLNELDPKSTKKNTGASSGIGLGAGAALGLVLVIVGLKFAKL